MDFLFHDQNHGFGYVQAADRVAACNQALRNHGWCRDESACPSQGRHITTRLSGAACQEAQRCLMAPEYAYMGFSGTEDGRGQQQLLENHDEDALDGIFAGGVFTGYAAFHADDVASRESGLLACGHLVDLMLRCDVKIANHTQQ